MVQEYFSLMQRFSSVAQLEGDIAIIAPPYFHQILEATKALPGGIQQQSCPSRVSLELSLHHFLSIGTFQQFQSCYTDPDTW